MGYTFGGWLQVCWPSLVWFFYLKKLWNRENCKIGQRKLCIIFVFFNTISIFFFQFFSRLLHVTRFRITHHDYCTGITILHPILVNWSPLLTRTQNGCTYYSKTIFFILYTFKDICFTWVTIHANMLFSYKILSFLLMLLYLVSKELFYLFFHIFFIFISAIPYLWLVNSSSACIWCRQVGKHAYFTF